MGQTVDRQRPETLDRVHKVHSLRHELLSTGPLHERPHTFSCCPLTPKRSVTRVNPLTSRQLNRACHAAARLAEIDKPVSLHSLRHSFADRAVRRMGLCSPFSSLASLMGEPWLHATSAGHAPR